MLSLARVQERLARRTLALVVAVGRGSRLKQRPTARPSPPSFRRQVPHHRFRAVNCLNSNVPDRHAADTRRIACCSICRWAGRFCVRSERVSDLLPAQQRLDEATWRRGTADAVFQNFDICAPRVQSSSSCWPAITSTRWTTRTCSPTCRRRGPIASSPVSRCRRTGLRVRHHGGRRP